jgi:two-component system, LytTR family, sensor kinase
MRLPPVVTWAILFLLTTVLGALSLFYRYLDDLARGRGGTFPQRLLEQATGVYAAFVLLPLVFRVARVYLFERRGWLRRGLALLVAAVAFSLLHTSMMALSRQLLFPAFGLGRYDYGLLRYRYPMELSNYLGLFAMIVVLYYFFTRLRLAQEQQLATAELQAKLAEAQLDNLRLQLQPHFLFNTLNTISSVMYEDVHAADAMLTQLADLLRLTLRTSRSPEIPLAEELQITRLYLDLMQKRFEGKLHVAYAIDPGLAGSLVPQLVLQPLVENSLRHAWKPDGAGMDIWLAAALDDGHLVLRVSDSGVGLGARRPDELLGRGLGLSNIQRRLDRLYGSEQQLSIANRVGGGAEVTLRLPHRPGSRG